MLGKKDPGKFTVRFNMADPQQSTVIDLLNRQGRYKAQFLTSAVLHYIHCSETPDIYGTTPVNNSEIEGIVRKILAEQQTGEEKIVGPAIPMPTLQHGVSDMGQDYDLGDTDKDAIFRTLEAFQKE